MSFAPTDSELFGPLFATDAMRACFSDAAWVGSMLAVEAALARSEGPGRLGARGARAGDRGDPSG